MKFNCIQILMYSFCNSRNELFQSQQDTFNIIQSMESPKQNYKTQKSSNIDQVRSFVRINNYPLCNIISNNGTYGMVRRSVIQNNKYALKVLFNTPSKEDLAEVKALQKIGPHDNIVELVQVLPSATCYKLDGTTTQKFVLVLKYIDSTILREYVYSERFSEELAILFFSQLLNAIEFLHGNNIGHRDIKLENLMIDINQGLKLCDFGFACSLGLSDERNVGTKYINDYLMYIYDKPYDIATADLFSAGIVLLYMAVGRPIFDRANASDAWYKAVIENKWPLIWNTLENQYLKPSRFTKTTTISAPLRDLLEHMLSANPNKRLTISQIKRHPWFMNTQKPDLTQFRNFFNETQEKLRLEGRRNADVEEGWEEFEENVPEVNLSKLPVLEEYEKPDKVVDYGFKELMARIQWILTIDPNLWRKVEVKGEGSEIRFLIKFWDDDRLYLEGEQPENKAQNGEDKEVGSMEVELFWTHDKKLALHFVLSEEVNPYTYHKIKSGILEIL